MIPASDGSRPDPKQFLTGYAQIKGLQSERVPAPGDYALKGKEDLQTIKGKASAGIIQV